jgi:hypothetical protein
MPQGKEPLEKGFGKPIHGTIGRISNHHDGAGVAHFFSQLGKIILYLAEVVFFATQAGDAWLHFRFA